MTRKGYSRFLVLIHLIGDISILNGAFIFAYILVNSFKNFDDINDQYVMLHILFNLVWLIIMLALKVTEIGRNTRLEQILWNVFKAIILHGLVILSIIAMIKGNYFSNSHLLWTYGFFFVGLTCWRLLFYLSLRQYRRQGANYRNVIIIGAGRVGNDVYNYLTTNDTHGYKFLGFFDDNPENCLHRDKIMGTIRDIDEFSRKVIVDEIFIALPLSSAKTIRELISFADNNLMRVKVIPDFRGFLHKKVNIDFYEWVPVLTIRPEPLENLMNRVVKRSFDIVFSMMVIVLVFPWLFPILALLIKLSSPGPVFFVQLRSGRNNNVFPCYKFRSMAVNNDSDKLQAIQGDPRITWIGKVLRRTNMDELPQFINVFLGNMSVVGPRPHMLKHTEDYSKLIDKFMVRHLVKPGITGLAQVNGYRGPTTDKRRMYKRVRYDVWYLENWSFLLDLKIIFLTVYNMFRGEKNAL